LLAGAVCVLGRFACWVVCLHAACLLVKHSTVCPDKFCAVKSSPPAQACLQALSCQHCKQNTPRVLRWGACFSSTQWHTRCCCCLCEIGCCQV
jgi:hypothetical protein